MCTLLLLWTHTICRPRGRGPPYLTFFASYDLHTVLRDLLVVSIITFAAELVKVSYQKRKCRLKKKGPVRTDRPRHGVCGVGCVLLLLVRLLLLWSSPHVVAI